MLSAILTVLACRRIMQNCMSEPYQLKKDIYGYGYVSTMKQIKQIHISLSSLNIYTIFELKKIQTNQETDLLCFNAQSVIPKHEIGLIHWLQNRQMQILI